MVILLHHHHHHRRRLFVVVVVQIGKGSYKKHTECALPVGTVIRMGMKMKMIKKMIVSVRCYSSSKVDDRQTLTLFIH